MRGRVKICSVVGCAAWPREFKSCQEGAWVCKSDFCSSQPLLGVACSKQDAHAGACCTAWLGRVLTFRTPICSRQSSHMHAAAAQTVCCCHMPGLTCRDERDEQHAVVRIETLCVSRKGPAQTGEASARTCSAQHKCTAVWPVAGLFATGQSPECYISRSALAVMHGPGYSSLSQGMLVLFAGPHTQVHACGSGDCNSLVCLLDKAVALHMRFTALCQFWSVSAAIPPSLLLSRTYAK